MLSDTIIFDSENVENLRNIGEYNKLFFRQCFNDERPFWLGFISQCQEGNSMCAAYCPSSVV